MTFALGSFSAAGCLPFPGIVVGGRVVSLHAASRCLAASGRALSGARSMLSLLESWDHDRPLIEEVAEALAHSRTPELDACSISLEALSVHAPVPAPRHIYCTEGNYRKHVVQLTGARANGKIETTSRKERALLDQLRTDAREREGTPYFFLKAQSSVTGPYDPIVLPADAREPDWGLELAAVIGRTARHVSREQALHHVAGYTVANDVTRRELMSRRADDVGDMDMNWVVAKSSPTFLPLGPYLIPAACIGDPQDLRIRVRLNDEVVQEESTSQMIFSTARLIEHLSTVVELQPGDLILTGSPAGGDAHRWRFLRPGDLLEGTICALGTQRNRCIREQR